MYYNDYTFVVEGNVFSLEASRRVEQMERGEFGCLAGNGEEGEPGGGPAYHAKEAARTTKNPELREPVVNFLIASRGGE